VILFSSFGVTWNGARVFNGRAALPGSLIAGAVVWLVSQWPGFEAAGGSARPALLHDHRGLHLARRFRILRGRNEPLVSRWPAIVLPDPRHDVPAAHAAQRVAGMDAMATPSWQAPMSCSASKPS